MLSRSKLDTEGASVVFKTNRKCLAIYIMKMWVAIGLLAFGFVGVILSAAFSFGIGIIISVVVMLIALILAMVTYGVCECNHKDDNASTSIPDEWYEKIYQYQV